MNNTKTIKEILTPFDIGHSKVHLGPHYDGGYVVSETCLANTKAVYSLGIGTECDFDLELAQRGLPIYQYEAHTNGPPKQHENFHFSRMFMTAQTFEQELHRAQHQPQSLLLSMDIEGGEYDLLINTDTTSLDKFNQLCFEIHDVLYNTEIYTLLNKINKQFVLIHIHANNNCIRSGAFSSGIRDQLPNVLELTYVHRNCVNQTPTVSKQACPIIGLDFKNQLDLEEVVLDWWITQ